ncbi:hypothetical protein DSO57_1005107 [Entomophthora muscae]|uniref:Uncharacterized protein n=1 Tax=Entomophthora muscae TaxID=34485 RepID=A0ACC2SA56_9FUNG|nr:hypothetical protein DSO57_1005107 [Entomophthora muscae]
MTPQNKEFLGKGFKRMFHDGFWPKEGSIPAEVKIYEGDACMVIEKFFEEFSIFQVKYNVLAKESLHLENDIPTQPAPGTDPEHLLVPEKLEHHRDPYESFYRI